MSRPTPVPPKAVVLMGVCGCGKTTVGRLLAERLGWQFFDGDDFHPKSNVDKMASGKPLDDDDRRPWLEALRDLIDRRLEAGETTILACSALKQSYRQILGTGRSEVLLVHLAGSRELLAERLKQRTGHYMPPDLLDSQSRTLEEPGESALRLDISVTPQALVSDLSRLVAG